MLVTGFSILSKEEMAHGEIGTIIKLSLSYICFIFLALSSVLLTWFLYKNQKKFDKYKFKTEFGVLF
jgi:hypothetical protein